MRKMVNSMSAKMEIGSPMASMYLLGNPDHYASHLYVPFAWRSYFIPTSGVDDYRFRPAVYSNVTLYEWVQCSEKKKRSAKERELFEDEIRLARHYKSDYHKAALKRFTDEGELLNNEDDPLEDEFDDDDFIDFEPGAGSLTDDRDYESEWETDDEAEVILEKQTKLDKAKKTTWHAYLPEHGQFPSHAVTCYFDRLATTIPNFIGGSVPRSDKGDRAAYCMTMLTLFKPWRSPVDLKDGISTWDQAFKEHTFTERQTQLIKNFDVRYECNDARDDHFAQMRKKLAEANALGKSLLPTGFLPFKDKFADDLNDFDYGSDDGMDADFDEEQKGPRTLKMIAEAKEIRNIMQTSGWLDPLPDGTFPAAFERIFPPLRPPSLR
ncbi:hypothetical protein B0H16DRAFT_1327430 [Mycena metata]|uniref:Uncharacterized protein n=1 Tax=Mycena metata TaxID=1033252 RepID=A0AAD7MX45_9AGAR|nr:hypothetical protein B0H16DRAFT_1327430 [Mycena metata]